MLRMTSTIHKHISMKVFFFSETSGKCFAHVMFVVLIIKLIQVVLVPDKSVPDHKPSRVDHSFSTPTHFPIASTSSSQRESPVKTDHRRNSVKESSSAPIKGEGTNWKAHSSRSILTVQSIYFRWNSLSFFSAPWSPFPSLRWFLPSLSHLDLPLSKKTHF